MKLVAVIVCLVLFAHASPPAHADAGEEAYREACASCHRTPARFMRRYLEMTPQARWQALDTFLRDHHAPQEQQRAAIIAWLEANHTRR